MLGNKNFILPELTPGKSGVIFTAFLIIFCFHFSSAQAYYNNSDSCLEKCHQEQGKTETVTLVSDRSGDTQRLTASNVYKSPSSDSARNSTRNLPLPDICSIDLPVDDIDTRQVKHSLNTGLTIDPEHTGCLTLVLDSFDQTPVENIILSHLRTVVLLH